MVKHTKINLDISNKEVITLNFLKVEEFAKILGYWYKYKAF